MTISSANIPYYKAPINATSDNMLKKESGQSAAGTMPSFASMITSDLSDKRQNWAKTEQAVTDVVLGKADSETVIPLIAQTAKEFETAVRIVESVSSAFTKILDTQI